MQDDVCSLNLGHKYMRS